MMPGPGDHLLVAVIAVAYPLYFTLDWNRRVRPQLETGDSPSRLRFYRRSMLELWLLTPVVLAWWLWCGRPITAVGLGVPGGWAFWTGAVVYLGWGVGVFRATVVGAVLGAAYLLTGTLWVPIALHAMVDVTSGLTGSAAFEADAAGKVGE